jgi:hypothetical protein
MSGGGRAKRAQGTTDRDFVLNWFDDVYRRIDEGRDRNRFIKHLVMWMFDYEVQYQASHLKAPPRRVARPRGQRGASPSRSMTA